MIQCASMLSTLMLVIEFDTVKVFHIEDIFDIPCALFRAKVGCLYCLPQGQDCDGVCHLFYSLDVMATISADFDTLSQHMMWSWYLLCLLSLPFQASCVPGIYDLQRKIKPGSINDIDHQYFYLQNLLPSSKLPYIFKFCNLLVLCACHKLL